MENMFVISLTIFITSMVYIGIIAGVALFLIMEKKKNNIDIIIRRYERGGRVVPLLYRGYKKTTNEGEFIIIPKLKHKLEGYIPYFGSQYLHSIANQNGRLVYDVSYNDAYAPNLYNPDVKENVTSIELKVDANGKPMLDPVTKKFMFEKIEKEVILQVCRPIRSSNREFYLTGAKRIYLEHKLLGGFWSQWGMAILGTGVLVIGCIMIFMMWTSTTGTIEKMMEQSISAVNHATDTFARLYGGTGNPPVAPPAQ